MKKTYFFTYFIAYLLFGSPLLASNGEKENALYYRKLILGTNKNNIIHTESLQQVFNKIQQIYPNIYQNLNEVITNTSILLRPETISKLIYQSNCKSVNAESPQTIFIETSILGENLFIIINKSLKKGNVRFYLEAPDITCDLVLSHDKKMLFCLPSFRVFNKFITSLESVKDKNHLNKDETYIEINNNNMLKALLLYEHLADNSLCIHNINDIAVYLSCILYIKEEGKDLFDNTIAKKFEQINVYYTSNKATYANKKQQKKYINKLLLKINNSDSATPLKKLQGRQFTRSSNEVFLNQLCAMVNLMYTNKLILCYETPHCVKANNQKDKKINSIFKILLPKNIK